MQQSHGLFAIAKLLVKYSARYPGENPGYFAVRVATLTYNVTYDSAEFRLAKVR